MAHPDARKCAKVHWQVVAKQSRSLVDVTRWNLTAPYFITRLNYYQSKILKYYVYCTCVAFGYFNTVFSYNFSHVSSGKKLWATINHLRNSEEIYTKVKHKSKSGRGN